MYPSFEEMQKSLLPAYLFFVHHLSYVRNIVRDLLGFFTPEFIGAASRFCPPPIALPLLRSLAGLSGAFVYGLLCPLLRLVGCLFRGTSRSLSRLFHVTLDALIRWFSLRICLSDCHGREART
jgi:hypothetical protein